MWSGTVPLVGECRVASEWCVWGGWSGVRGASWRAYINSAQDGMGTEGGDIKDSTRVSEIRFLGSGSCRVLFFLL